MPLVVSFEFGTTSKPGHTTNTKWTSNPFIRQDLTKIDSQTGTQHHQQKLFQQKIICCEILSYCQKPDFGEIHW